MSGFGYKILLDECDAVDRHVLTQAIHAHIPSIVFVKDGADFDLKFDVNAFFKPPYRIGKILDYLDREMFKNQYPETIEHADYVLNCNTSILSIGYKKYYLSDREKTLVAELLLAKNNGCSRDYLLKKIWDYKPDLETHALETQIYRLRQKIEEEPDTPKRLVTIDGGYKIHS